QIRNGSGRVVGIVYPQQFGAIGDLSGYRAEVRQKAVLFFQWDEVRLSAAEGTSGKVNRVARARYQHDVVRVHHCGGEVGDSLLGADKGTDRGALVKTDPDPPFVPPDGSRPERF